MHGVKRESRANTSAEARTARKEKEAARLAAYLDVERNFFELKKSRTLTPEALEACTRLLTLNPELYTAWNFRREALLAIFDAPLSQEELQGPKPQRDFFADALAESQSAEGAGEASDAGAGTSSTSGTSGDNGGAREAGLKAMRAKSLLSDDLSIVEAALRVHPKVYWVWNHRKWCLETLTSPRCIVATSEEEKRKESEQVWREEMQLVDKMLTLDPRNFHGWNYRRWVISQLASPSEVCFPASLSSAPSSSSPHASADRKADLALAESELSYTLRQIERNFSNFSAWHQRSKLLPRVWEGKGYDEASKKSERDNEFELVKQAMYTDPADQSVWIYHRWLIEQAPTRDVLEREIEVIEELLELEPESKWCMQSLAHYKSLLRSLLLSSSTSASASSPNTPTTSANATDAETQAKTEKLQADVRSLLGQLARVDPDRADRYREIEARQEV